MNKQRFLSILLLFMGLFKQYATQAQCPATIVLSTPVTTAATCPATGTALIHSNAPKGSLNYQLIAGPANFNQNPQTDSNFFSLTAGNYSVRAYCAGGTAADTISFSIADGYTPITMTPTATPTTCNSASNGTIAITETGGSLPIQYSVVREGQPDSYGTATTFTGLGTGNYTVKVKDACGSVVVQAVQIVSSALPPVNANFQLQTVTVCHPANDTIQFYGLVDSNGTSVVTAPYFTAGLTVKVYNGTSASAPLLGTYTITSDFQSLSIPAPTTPDGYFIVTTVAPCGDTMSQQWTGAVPPPPDINFKWGSAGCAGTPAGGKFSLVSVWITNTIFPVTVYVKNPTTGTTLPGWPKTYNTGDLDANGNLVISGIDTGTVNIYALDACGDTASKLEPVSFGAGAANTPALSYWAYSDCSTQPGYVWLQFYLADGSYIRGSFSSDTKYVIVSGPSGVGDTLGSYYNYGTVADAIDLMPGNYRVAVVTPCTKDTLSITIDSTNIYLASVTASATSFCGSSGSVNIASTQYTGSGSVGYILYNTATNAAVPLSSNPADTLGNSSTVWTNLPAGNYKIAMLIQNWCIGYDYPYIINGNTVTITNGNSPTIIRKEGINCTSGTATGVAFLELAGVQPFTLTYIKNGATGTPTTINNADPLTEIDNLEQNSIYNISLSDACGNTISTQVSISNLAMIGVTNTVQSCAGRPYTLSVPDYAGASYEWKNPEGAVVSNTSSYYIVNYNASFNGTYICTINFGSCVSQTVLVTLNSDLCGQQLAPLPITLGAFNAENSNGAALLQWNTLTEINDKGFDIQRSANAQTWVDIGFVNSKATNGNSTSNINYSFTDNNPANGINYYRLKQEDLNGSSDYSQVKSVDFGVKATIYPNPVSNQLNVTVAGNSNYQLINAAGNVVMTGSFSTGNNVLNVSGITAGTYLLRITSNSSSTVYKVIKK